MPCFLAFCNKLVFYSRPPLAAEYKGLICGRSPAEIVGSNPAGDMDVCVLWMFCDVR